MDINLISQILEKPKRRSFGSNAVRVTRNGLSSNPTQRLNYVGGDIFANNVLAMHGNNYFIGGDTATFEYDFSTKVAGSVAECPCRIYHSKSSTIQNPPGLSSYWDGQPSAIDKLRTNNDSNVLTDSTSVSGETMQFTIEIDLTPLANAYFGGSNSALKSALKGINVDVWAMGSGSNGGVSANGVVVSTHNGIDWCSTSWDTGYTFWSKQSSSASVSKLSINLSGNSNSSMVTANSNKLYLLVYSQFASDGTIASSVSLDYINIKVEINRTIDTVQPIMVSL